MEQGTVLATDLRTYLDGLEKAKGDRRAALNSYNAARKAYDAAFRPIGGKADERALRSILDLCPNNSGYPRSYIFVCLTLLYYSPEALLGGKIPLVLAKGIAGVLGVKPPSIYIARNKVAFWLRTYPDFFKKVSRLFDSIPDAITKGG